MDSVIRDYVPQDETRLLALLNLNNQYFAAIDPWGALQFPKGAEMFYLNQMIADTAKRHGKFYVAEVTNGAIAGFIQGGMHTQTEAEIMERGKSTSGDIEKFFVLEEFRSHGIGTKLIATMENYFKSQGCTAVALSVFAPNQLARNFYANYGFTERALILVKRLPSNLSSAK